MNELVYDPNNPLSDEELDKIAEEDFDKFLEYLDSKTAYFCLLYTSPSPRD